LRTSFFLVLREGFPPITHAFYSISLKKIVSGELNYGRTKFDLNNGAMFFMAPRQVLQWEETAVFEQKGFSIYFHEDFIKGTELAHQIQKYGFFSYSFIEALHLISKGRITKWTLYLLI